MKPEEFGLTVEVEEITPIRASEYLNNNAKHREINQRKVEKLAGDLENQNWQLNGKVIIFDSNGRLLNGQHRLSACVASGKTLTTLVVRGVNPATFDEAKDYGQSV